MALLGEFIAELKLDALDFARGMDEVAANFDKHVKEMAGLGLALSAAITAPLVKIGMEALNMSTKLDQAQQGFTHLLGSAEMAGEFLKDLASFAEGTPFEFPELIPTAQNMINLGMRAKDVIPTLSAVSEAMVGLGKGKAEVDSVTTALARMATGAVKPSMAFRTLATEGINAFQMLADATGKSVEQVRKDVMDGAITGKAAMEAIVSGLNNTFEGSLKHYEDTSSGALSHISDIWATTLGTLGKSLEPLYKDFLNGFVLPVVEDIKQVIDWFSQLSDPIKKFIVVALSIAGAIGPGMLALAGFIKTTQLLGTTLGPVFSTAQAGLGLVTKGAAALFAEMAASSGGSAFLVLFAAATPLLLSFGAALIATWSQLDKMRDKAGLLKGSLEDLYVVMERGGGATKKQGEDIERLTQLLKNYNDEASLQGKPNIPIPEMNLSLANPVPAQIAALKEAAGKIPGITSVMKGLNDEFKRTGNVDLTKTLKSLDSFTKLDFKKTGMVDVSATVASFQEVGKEGSKSYKDLVDASKDAADQQAILEAAYQGAKSRYNDLKASYDQGLGTLSAVKDAFKEMQQAAANLHPELKNTGLTQDILNKAFAEAQSTFELTLARYKDGIAIQADLGASLQRLAGLGAALDKSFSETVGVSKELIDAEKELAATSKSQQLPAVLSLTEAYGQSYDARVRLAAATQTYREAEAKLADLHQRGLSNTKEGIQAYLTEQAAKQNLASATEQYADKQKQLSDIQKVTTEQTHNLDQMSKQYKDTLDQLVGHSILPLADAMKVSADADKKTADALAVLKDTHEEYAAFVAAIANPTSAETTAWADKIAEAEYNVTQAQAGSTDATTRLNEVREMGIRVAQELVAGEEALQQAYDALDPSLKSLTEEVNNLRVARFAVIEALGVEADALANLERAQESGNSKTILDAEKLLAEAKNQVSIATAHESTVLQKLTTDYNVTAEAAKGVTTSTDLLTVASENAQLALSALGLNSVPKLKMAADKAKEYFFAIAQDANTTSTQVIQADLAMAKANLAFYESIGDTSKIEESKQAIKDLGAILTTLPPIIMTTAEAYKLAGVKTLDELQQDVVQNKAAFDRITGDMDASEQSVYEITKRWLESLIKLRAAMGDMAGAKDAAQALKDLEALHVDATRGIVLTHQTAAKTVKDTWKAFGKEISTIINDLGKGIADKLIGMFHDTTNSDLDKQAKDLQKSLDERTTAWGAYQADTADKMAKLTEDNATQLDKQLTDIQSNLDEKAQSYDEYVADVATKLDRLQTDSAESLDRELTDLKQSLRDKVQSYDDYVTDANTKLARLGQDTADNIADETRSTKKGITDKQKAFNRDQADTLKKIDQLTKEHKAGNTQQIADLRLSLTRKKSDLDDYINQANADLAEYTSEQKLRQARETADAKLELDRRKRDQDEFLAENAAAQAQAISDSALKLQRETDDIALDLAQRTADYEKYQQEQLDNADEIKAKAATDLADGLKNLQDNLTEQKTAYDTYVEGVKDKLQEIADKHTTIWGNMLDLLTGEGGVFDQIGKAFIRLFIDKGITALGGLLKQIPGLGGIFGTATSAAGDAAGAAGDIGGDLGSSIAKGVGAGVSGIVSAVTGVVSAVTDVMGVFREKQMDKALNDIEEHTKVIAMAIAGIDEPWGKVADSADTLFRQVRDGRYEAKDFFEGAFGGWYRLLIQDISDKLDDVVAQLRTIKGDVTSILQWLTNAGPQDTVSAKAVSSILDPGSAPSTHDSQAALTTQNQQWQVDVLDTLMKSLDYLSKISVSMVDLLAGRVTGSAPTLVGVRSTNADLPLLPPDSEQLDKLLQATDVQNTLQAVVSDWTRRFTDIFVAFVDEQQKQSDALRSTLYLGFADSAYSLVGVGARMDGLGALIGMNFEGLTTEVKGLRSDLGAGQQSVSIVVEGNVIGDDAFIRKLTDAVRDQLRMQTVI
jgi:tape measure domain-containing protein